MPEGPAVGQRFQAVAALRSILDAVPADELTADQTALLRDEALAAFV